MSCGGVEKFEPGDLVLWCSMDDSMLGLKPRPALVVSQYRYDDADGVLVRWADTLKEQDLWPVFDGNLVRPAGNDE